MRSWEPSWSWPPFASHGAVEMHGSFLEPPPLPAPQVGEVVRFDGVRTIDGVMLGSPSGLGPVLLAHLHSPECPDGHRWHTTDIHRLREAVRPWGGHVLLIPASQFGSQPTRSWIAVADQWGEIFHSVSCEPLHGSPRWTSWHVGSASWPSSVPSARAPRARGDGARTSSTTSAASPPAPSNNRRLHRREQHEASHRRPSSRGARRLRG